MTNATRQQWIDYLENAIELLRGEGDLEAREIAADLEKLSQEHD